MNTALNQNKNERQMIRVLVIHGNPLFSLGIRATLERHGMQIVGETIQREEIVEIVASEPPDVVLLDGSLAFGEYSAAKVVTQLRQAGSRGIFVFVPSLDEELLFLFMRNGAAAYELPTLAGDELVEKVRRVADGEYLITSEVLQTGTGKREQRKSPVRTEAPSSPVSQAQQDLGITNREIEVLACIMHGLSNKQIARRLAISDQTVKNHITSVLRRLNARDRTAAVVMALRHGLITFSHVLPEPQLTSPFIPLRNMPEAQNHRATSRTVTPRREEVAV